MNLPPLHAPPEAGNEPTRAAQPLPGFIVALAVALAGAFWLYRRCPGPLSLGVVALVFWVWLAAVLRHCHSVFEGKASLLGRPSRFATHGQWIALLGLIGVFTGVVFPAPGVLGPLSQSSPESLRGYALIYLGIGAGLFVYCQFAESLQQRLHAAALADVLRLAWLLPAACGAAAGLIYLQIATKADYSAPGGWLALGLATALAIEPWTRFGLRQFLPKGLRQPPLSAGTSLWLKAALSGDAGAGAWIKEVERVVGKDFRQLWILRFLRAAALPVFLAGLLLAWGATCLHSIPIASRGVLVTMGRWATTPLEPGLHLTWPWPFAQILSVETGRVREISLGFERETNLPVLWTKAHVEGEKNLLVDHGETLLTINVPILYRIADPVGYLAAATDPEAALKCLAERQLVRVAATRESFHLMTEDRQAIAEALKTSLQAEADRHGFGVEITFVGLKDIHPPLKVAPAYQQVVSAQESKEAAIDRARAYEAQTVPLARSEALNLTIAAEADRAKRVGQAVGETGRFDAVAATERLAPALFRARLEYDAFDETLPKATKTIIGVAPHGAPPEFDLDFRPAATRAADVPGKISKP
ncbi:MAG: protease modulator HflK [Chthoniobacteraceae bacterium]